MKRLLVICGFALVVPLSVAGQGLRFAVSFSEERSADNLDGRLLLMISNDPSQEPRFQISDGPTTQLIFGIDVDGLAPGEDAIFAGSVLGYPIGSLNDIPAGRYRVQALLHKYETFHRADSHVVKLPMDRGEGQQSRSGQQWDIWEAVYSPVGADGYPMRLWDKLTEGAELTSGGFGGDWY